MDTLHAHMYICTNNLESLPALCMQLTLHLYPQAAPSPVGSDLQGIDQEARSMALRTWLLCLLLLGLVLSGASSRAHQHSMETRSE